MFLLNILTSLNHHLKQLYVNNFFFNDLIKKDQIFIMKKHFEIFL